MPLHLFYARRRKGDELPSRCQAEPKPPALPIQYWLDNRGFFFLLPRYTTRGRTEPRYASKWQQIRLPLDSTAQQKPKPDLDGVEGVPRRRRSANAEGRESKPQLDRQIDCSKKTGIEEKSWGNSTNHKELRWSPNQVRSQQTSSATCMHCKVWV